MPSHHRPARAALASLLLAGIVAACDTSPPLRASPMSPAASVDVEEGGIEGIVVDPEGNPVADAIVTIETVSGGFYGTTRTAPDGTFFTRGVSGDFIITINDLDYQPEIRRVAVEPGQLVTVEITLQPFE
jgi:hypothetical protein